MATTEKNGTMKYKDGAGNVTTMYPKTKVSQVDGLSDAIEETKPFVVTIQIIYSPGEADTYTADKTHAEIRAAIDAGKRCYAIVSDIDNDFLEMLFPVAANPELVEFVASGGRRTMIMNILSDNSIEVQAYDAQPLIEATGLLKGSGDGNISAAEAGTDYVTPDGMNTAIQSAIQNTWEASY